MSERRKEDLPVSVEIVRRVRPECVLEFELLLEKLIRFAVRAPGHLGATVFRPESGSTQYRVLIKFDSENRFRRFQDSEGLRKWYARIRPLLLEDPTIRVTRGLEAWFSIAEHPRHRTPRSWKIALVTWLAVYACVMLFATLLRAAGVNLHPWLQTLATCFLVTLTLQWVLMPWLTRTLRAWLFDETRQDLPSPPPRGR